MGIFGKKRKEKTKLGRAKNGMVFPMVKRKGGWALAGPGFFPKKRK